MTLEVRTKDAHTDTISVSYDAKAKHTLIVSDCDIVTLGIAAKVLQEMYADSLKNLGRRKAAEVDMLISKAVKASEKH